MSESESEPTFDPQAIAAELEHAWQSRAPIAPFTETGAVTSVEQAYAVQTEWARIRVERGDRLLGRKVGLTSRAMQEQFGVKEADFGGLWDSRYYPSADGRAEVPLETFLQAKIEGEIAFRLGSSLRGPGVTPEQVLEATEALAVAAEIIDSRIENWRIRLIDTVADNGSFGGFTCGSWDVELPAADLPGLRMVIRRGEELLVEGFGSAVLGHPAASVAWLANKLAEFGVTLEPGEIVLSGSLGKALPVDRGDEFVIEIDGQPPLVVAFA